MNKEKKETELQRVERWQANPKDYLDEVLGVKQTWDLQDQLLLACPRAIKEHKHIYVASGHALGKDFITAAVSLWFLHSYSPSKVLQTAPCNDDKTEILTNNGWKFFKDLIDKDMVAQRKGDFGLEFVKPTDIISFDYDGELIGFQNQLVDFLVTPNHRCLFNNEIHEAQEIYGTTGKFTKIASWGNKENDEDWLEFLGFWFAEGYAEYNEDKRKYRIVVTQKNKEDYVKDLLERVKHHFANELKIDKRQYGGSNYTFYDKKQARYFATLGKTMTKRVPQWVRSAGTKGIKAFIKGFLEGDGSIDLNGSIKLCSSNDGLADDLHELCVKAGYISNKRTYTCDEYKIEHDGARVYRGEKTGGRKTYYEVKIWEKRGKYPTSARQTYSTQKYWYKEHYKGKVYSVTVPYGVVMIRRNGKNSWTGNTDRQVKKIMWGETMSHWNDKIIDLGGIPYANPYLEIVKDKWFLIGFTTKDTGAAKESGGGKFQGFHSPNICIIVSEAQAVEDTIYDQIEGVATSENVLVIYIGNPTRARGRFAKGLRNPVDNIVFNFSCLDNPNYKQRQTIVPGLASYEWVENKRKLWGENDPRWQGRVLGEIPNVAVNNILTTKDIEQMKERHGFLAQYSANAGVALDPAGEGVDYNEFISGKGGEVMETYSKSNMSPSEQAHYAVEMCHRINGNFVVIDVDGVGIGAFQEAKKFNDRFLNGVQIVKFHGSARLPRDLKEKDNYYNHRTEAAFVTQRRARAGRAAINDEHKELIEDLMEDEYFEKNGFTLLEPKEDIKDRLGRSPGKGDAYKMLQWALDKHIKPNTRDGESTLPQYAVTDGEMGHSRLPAEAIT